MWVQIPSSTLLSKYNQSFKALSPNKIIYGYADFKKRNIDFVTAWSYPESSYTYKSLKRFFCSDKLNLFTKHNPEKLYAVNDGFFFLSPGIILRYKDDDDPRCYKRKMRIWNLTVSCAIRMSSDNFVLCINFQSLRTVPVLQKISLEKKKKIFWIFIKTSFSKNPFFKKGRRRIKKWVRKKHFRFYENFETK